MPHAEDPLLVLLTVVVLEIASRYLRLNLSAPKASKEERQLVEDIKRLRREAEHLITPDTFAQSAKLTRQANAKEKQLKQLRERKISLPVSTLLSTFVPILIQGVTRTVLVALFWGRPVAVLPVEIAQPLGFLVSFPHGEKWQGGGAVSIMFWLFCASQLSSSVLDFLKI